MGDQIKEDMDELPEGALDAVPENIKAEFMPKLSAIFTNMAKFFDDCRSLDGYEKLSPDMKARGTAIRESLQDVNEEIKAAGVTREDFHTMATVCKYRAFYGSNPGP